MEEVARDWLRAGGHFEWVPPMGDTGKLSIFHAEFGDPSAPLLLLVHGFPTSSIDWHDVVDDLAATHRVCVLDLLGYYIAEILNARTGAVVAHDRGDSVALMFASRCAAGQTPFELTHLVLSNGNIFLPLSNLTDFQRLVLNPSTASSVLAATTPSLLAAGLGQTMFTPPRGLDDPAIAALADTFAFNDGIGVLHSTIQYLVERAEHEQEWLEALAAMPVKTTVVWGLYDDVSPLRVAAYVWNNYLAARPGESLAEFWLLPCSNHYLQNDQPREFVQVVKAALSDSSPRFPGALSAEPFAPVLLDRSRPLPLARDVLAGT
jgi:pimeloyl-ACP methyl ester carboxylesterase